MGKSADKKTNVKCSFCGKKHLKEMKLKGAGNHIGDSQSLARALMKVYKKPAHRHTFSTGKGKNKCAEAHHLICSESMDDSAWEKVCRSFGYNVNHKKNGVMLPADMRVACHYKVPLHKGNHDLTKGSGGLNYVNTVKQLIEPHASIAYGGDYCQDPKEIINKLNQTSKDIWSKVKNFIWTISPDGTDYCAGNKKGCLGVKEVKAKETTTDKFCPDKRIHNQVKLGTYFLER